MKTQVLISGAGPTGLMLAADLQRWGISYIIIDKKSGITDKTKALGVQARTLEIFEDLNIADKAVKRGKILKGAKVIAQGRVITEINLSIMGKGMSKYKYLLILPQSEVEELLYEKISSDKGEVWWENELVDFKDNASGIVANIKNSAGDTFEIEADYLVGCDGASSFVRNKLDFEFKGSTNPLYFYVVDTDVIWDVEDDAWFLASLDNDSFLGFFKYKEGRRFRLIGVLPESNIKDMNIDEISYEEIEKQIYEDSQIEMKLENVNWHSVYKVHTRKTDSFQKGRIFIAGDAAHVHTPAGGQGMNTGLGDAYNLSWKLAMVLQKKLKVDILKTYTEAEREEFAETLLKGTDRAFNFVSTPHPISGFIKTRIAPYVIKFLSKFRIIQDKFFKLISQIMITYPNSQLTISSNVQNIKAGDRFPYFEYEDTTVYNKMRDTNFYLIYSPSLPKISNLPDWIEHVPIELPSNIFGYENLYILVRPDKYISYIGKNIDPIYSLIDDINLRN